MQVTELPAEGLKRAFQVVVPAATLAERREKRLKELGADLKIPGFRPGKVPAAVVRQRYGSAVQGEVMQAALEETMKQLLADRGLRPALQPKVDLVAYGENVDLEYKVDMELLPEVPMPDFAGIALERQKATPGEAEIDAFLVTMAGRMATTEDVEEQRPAAKGDLLVCDFTGRMKNEDGSLAEPFEGGTATDMPVEVAGEGFIPGFTEQLVGLAPGESRDVEASFPADYGVPALAGKTAIFAVTAKGLKRRVLPTVDDEFAKRLGADDLAKLREGVSTNLQREYDSLARLRVKRALLDVLAEKAQFPVPDGMVEGEFTAIWQRVEQDLKAGRLDADDQGKDEDTLKAEYRAIAERRIRLGLLLSEIGRTNGITVTNDEIGAAVAREARRYPGQEKQVYDYFRKNQDAVEGLRAPIFEEKVVDFVLELAQVTEVPISPDELTKQTA